MLIPFYAFHPQSHDLFTDFKEKFTKIVQNQINRLLENTATEDYVASSEIVKFVNYSKTASQIINEDDEINQGLLELLESTENSTPDTENEEPFQSKVIKSSRNKRTVKEVEIERINQGLLEPLETTENGTPDMENEEPSQTEMIESSRNKRTVKQVESKVQRINLELQVLERLVQSKNESASVDAMKRLVEKATTIVTRLCNDSSFTYANFSKNFLLETRNLLIHTVHTSSNVEKSQCGILIQVNEPIKFIVILIHCGRSQETLKNFKNFPGFLTSHTSFQILFH